jgi:two-component system, NarL family, nitrate/nitrite response regulator NarL
MRPPADEYDEAALQSILIVDPNQVIRTGLMSMLQSLSSVVEVITCDDIASAVDITKKRAVNVLLVSEKFSAEQTGALREEAAKRDIKYFVTIRESSRPLEQDTLETVTHGVLLLETLTTSTLADTLQRIAADQIVMPAKLLQDMLRTSASGSRARSNIFPLLSSRELQVLTFISDGLSNKQIARKMSISEHGVKRHVANLLAKLDCPNRTQAVSYALQHGLLSNSGDGNGML